MNGAVGTICTILHDCATKNLAFVQTAHMWVRVSTGGVSGWWRSPRCAWVRVECPSHCPPLQPPHPVGTPLPELKGFTFPSNPDFAVEWGAFCPCLVATAIPHRHREPGSSKITTLRGGESRRCSRPFRCAMCGCGINTCLQSRQSLFPNPGFRWLQRPHN